VSWFVYMLECRGGRVYTGITRDVAARFAKHSAGRGGAFTRSWRPVRILAAKRCGSKGRALREEHRLKQLPRPGKLQWALKVRACARSPA
jgi:predicted GIY-YIG superfamily endonuclease